MENIAGSAVELNHGRFLTFLMSMSRFPCPPFVVDMFDGTREGRVISMFPPFFYCWVCFLFSFHPRLFRYGVVEQLEFFFFCISRAQHGWRGEIDSLSSGECLAIFMFDHETRRAGKAFSFYSPLVCHGDAIDRARRGLDAQLPC